MMFEQMVLWQHLYASFYYYFILILNLCGLYEASY